MAEEQKPVEVAPVEVAETPVVAPVEDTAAATTEAPAAVEDKVADAAGEPAEAPKEEEEKKDEAKPVEEGHLGYKAQGLSFPKNLIPSKEFFFFGSDAVEPKTLATYQKHEKSTENAHSNLAWASHTGKGLLFFGDKKAPTSLINLSHAGEPEVDGSNKFHFITKGQKHSFKAASVAERDSWVSQLKLKIAEAKELATSVTESETYKNTLESLKPAPVAAKEDKVAEAPKDEAKADEAKAEDAPKDDEAKTEETPKEETKAEEPKRRSASRKRASFFGFGKKEEKKEDVKADDVAKEETATEEPVVAETATEAAPETEAAKVEETAAETAASTEDKPAEEAATAESPKEKTASKRNSIFGSVFSKKEKKAAETKPVEATETKEDGETTETAPVIPPVEATTPLAVDVSSPATVPTENTEVTATNGETKKDVKEKRKSSLPFNFGKREKSPAPADGEKAAKGQSPFSKLRSTIKGKSSPKAEDKAAEEAVKDEAVKEEAVAEEAKPATEEVTAEEPAKVEEAAKSDETEAENKAENVAAVAPVVTAAA